MDKKERIAKIASEWGSVINSIFLTLVFTGLKLYGIIDWSWFWIVSPIWIGLIQMLCIFVITGIAFSILGLVYYIFGEEDKK